MGLRVDFWVLFGWLFVLGLLVVAAFVFLPLSGWGWSEGLKPYGCGPLGVCVDVEEPRSETRLEAVPMGRLLDCQSSGLDACVDLRSGPGTRVLVLVGDGVYRGRGVVLSRGKNGRPLRYLAVGEAGGGTDRALYCSYASESSGPLPELVEGAEEGDSLLLTTQVWWGDGSRFFETYDERGDPACVVRVISGRPWSG